MAVFPIGLNQVTISNGIYNSGSNPCGYIDHAEVAESDGGSSSPEELCGQEMSASRVLRCAWPDRLMLAQQILGGPILAGNFYSAGALNGKYSQTGGTADVYVFAPQQYPYNGYLVARSVKIVHEKSRSNDGYTTRVLGIAPAGTTLNWKYAYLAVEYSSPQSNYYNTYGEFIQETLVPSTEFITLPYQNLYWDQSAASPINASSAPAAQIKFLQWTVIRSEEHTS